MHSIRQYMRIGIVQGMAFPAVSKYSQGIVEDLKIIAKDDFFDVIEIGHIQDTAIRECIKQITDVSKLTVSYAGHSVLLSKGLNINDTTEAGRIKAVEALKESIDEAYYMKAESFAFLSGRYEEDKKEDALRALVQSTKELCDYAGRKGDMPVLLEVFDYNIDKKSLIGPVALVERFASQVAGEYANFGIMVDLSHLPLLGETPQQALLPIRQYIKHVHIGNAVVRDSSLEAYGDEHPRFGFPGSENDVEELADFLKVLLEIAYLNTVHPPIVSFEVKPRPDEDPELVVAGSKRALQKAWAKII